MHSKRTFSVHIPYLSNSWSQPKVLGTHGLPRATFYGNICLDLVYHILRQRKAYGLIIFKLYFWIKPTQQSKSRIHGIQNRFEELVLYHLMGNFCIHTAPGPRLPTCETWKHAEWIIGFRTGWHIDLRVLFQFLVKITCSGHQTEVRLLGWGSQAAQTHDLDICFEKLLLNPLCTGTLLHRDFCGWWYRLQRWASLLCVWRHHEVAMLRYNESRSG